MQPWITQPVFVVTPPPASAWNEPAKQDKPTFDDSEANKNLFGIELAKGASPFEAAAKIFSSGNGVTVWVAQNWIADPIVIAAKDLYLNSIQKKSKNLDKDELAAKILEFADEKFERNGQKFYVNEGKDRLAALNLYAKVQGYISEKTTEINNNNTVQTVVGIKLVKASDKDSSLTEAPKSKMLNDVDAIALPRLKLVNGSSA